MYTVRISKKAKKEINKIPHRFQKAIILSLTEIEDDPFIGKPLSRELTGRFSYRIGVYRIIYKINRKDKIIEILNAGHRATIYK